MNPPTAAPDPRDLRVEFGNEELSIPDIGLSIKIPADCGGTRTISPGANPRAKQQVAVQILPADMSEAWSIKISAPQVTNPNLTAERCADEAFRLLQTNLAAADQGSGLNKPAQTLTLIDRVPNESNPRKHLFGGQVRQVEFVRWYAKAPQSNGRSDVVRGLVVAKVGDTQFVTFDLTTTEKEFPGAKRMLEAVVAAATFKGPNDNVMDRRIAIQAGINLKRDLTFEKLQGVMAAKPELWLRWYMPAANGEKQDDTEVGYIRYQFIDEPKGGQRGLIDRTKPKANWGATERETGSVILTDLRFIDKNNIVDSQAGYFLRKDGDAEFWSVETAQRDSKSPNNPEVLREMGVRDMLSMQVETSSSRGNAQSIKPIMQGDQTYLSRVEELLVPQLLVRAQAQAEYAYYTWVGGAGRIRLRRDTVERVQGSPARWKITTRFGDEDPKMTSLYEDDGTFVRTELADHSIIEPSTYDELIKLWKTKGLPVDPIQGKK